MMVHDLKQKNCLFSDEILPNKIVSAWARRDLNSPVREESLSAQPESDTRIVWKHCYMYRYVPTHTNLYQIKTYS